MEDLQRYKATSGKGNLEKNQGSIFLGGSFSYRDNARAPIQFRRESQHQHLIKNQNLRDQQVVLVTIPNCPKSFSFFRYYKDIISCETFSKIFLQFWSYDHSKFSQFLGELPFLLFFQTLGKSF